MTKKKSSCKQSKKPTRTESCIYAIEILDWELPYSISINLNKKSRPVDGPFWEYFHLTLKGKFVHPENLANSMIESTLIGDRRLVYVVSTPETYDQYDPISIGKLTVRKGQRECFGSVPFDVLNNISFQLQVGKIRFLVLGGQPLYRGSTDVRSIRFQKDFTEEDLL